MRRYLTLLVLVAFIMSLVPFQAMARRLQPADFEDMYDLASDGNLGALMAATSRGLDIDALNSDGDAGICVAVKRGDYMAYNTFIKAGALAHHPCINNINKSRYASFMSSSRAVKYSEYPTSFIPRESGDLATILSLIGTVIGLGWIVSTAGSN